MAGEDYLRFLPDTLIETKNKKTKVLPQLLPSSNFFPVYKTRFLTSPQIFKQFVLTTLSSSNSGFVQREVTLAVWNDKSDSIHSLGGIIKSDQNYF